MIRTRAIVFTLGVLLFLFLNSNAHADSGLSYFPGHITRLLHVPQGRVKVGIPPNSHCFSKHIIKRYDIKVRYIGSAYSYSISPLPAQLNSDFPDTRFFSIDNRLVIPAGSHCLFVLRGPPNDIVAA